MSQRFEFCTLASSGDVPISDLCRAFGISRQTGYKWLKRFHESGINDLHDRSRRPHHSPFRTCVDVEAMIVSLRKKYPAWGPRKLHRLLRDRLAKHRLPSVVTVARILKRQGLIEAVEPAPVWPAVGRFERPHPNDLWQMDLKGALRLPDGRKIYPVGILDDHSRYLIQLQMVTDASDDSTLRCWIGAAASHGLPKATLTDHGPQFRMVDEESSAFRVYLWACGVHHTQGRVAHPQTQGKIERFWRTLKDELLSRRAYSDPASWQSSFDEWRHIYNHVRPHQELDDEPPVSRYRNSDRSYVEPNRFARIGYSGSQYRRVSPRGQISLGGKRKMIGRGYSGWTVEIRPLGDGCWHVYFRDQLVKEIMLTHQINQLKLPRSREILRISRLNKQ